MPLCPVRVGLGDERPPINSTDGSPGFEFMAGDLRPRDCGFETRHWRLD